ncbi:MAG: ATP-dependent Clp protease proteolytic subunit [Treponema sp.]|nr:ATP-dependent Clp protease proteolytic subunit [Treponema sp.]
MVDVLKKNYIRLDEEDDEDDKKKGKEGPDPLAEKFLKTRQILLSGEINEENAEKVIRQLFILEADSDKPIYIFIDSPGGDVDAGFAIFDAIRFVNAPVYTVGMGLIASAAALILLASPKERRLGLPHSHYLIHQPSSGMKGVATDIKIHAMEIAKTKAKINEIIAEETGTPLDKVTKDTDRDYWLTADESVSYGLISKVITRRDELK